MSHVVRISDGDLETGSRSGDGYARQVSRASGLGPAARRGVMMFDNEIDWVTRLKCRLVRREARRAGERL
jgi:hypothetical protein